MNFKTLLAAAAIALAPVLSFASTVPVPAPGVNSLGDAPFEFDQSYAAGSAGGIIDFIFLNDTGFAALFTIASGTVEQLSATFAGVTLEWLGSGETDTVASGAADGTLGPIHTNILGMGDQDTLRLTFGAVTDRPGDVGTGSGNIDFQVIAQIEPVPVPAGILLMGTAIAGFGVMRRRRKKAA